jgi:hypothetical protein
VTISARIQKQLRQAASFPRVDQIKACGLALRPALRLHDRVLQHADAGDAGGKSLNLKTADDLYASQFRSCSSTY